MIRAAAAGLCALLGAAPALAQGLVLSSGDRPGGLVIANEGNAPVTLRSAIRVERQEAGAWAPASAVVQAIASCAARPGPTVTLAPGARLSTVPWTGCTCGVQCPAGCRANVCTGGGPFRFVVEVAPDWHRAAGPPFTLPPAS